MGKISDSGNLSRSIQEMPDFVLASLREYGLEILYNQRPPYQRNDYLSWITRAVRGPTKQKRLSQMLDELQAGGVYMGMKWNGG